MINSFSSSFVGGGSDVVKPPLLWRMQNFLRWSHVLGMIAIFLSQLMTQCTGVPTIVGTWEVAVRRRDGSVVDYGVVCRRLITTAALIKFADAFHDNSFNASTFTYGGIGTGTNAPAAGDTALQTELTTQLNPDSVRATATSSKPTTTSVLKTFTATVDATVSVTEFGVFSQAATGGGTLLDRGTSAAVALVSGDGFMGKLTITFQTA